MASRFKNYDFMLSELRKHEYENEWTHDIIHNCEPTDDQIVYLFNIHCMPAKYEVSQPINKPRGGRR